MREIRTRVNALRAEGRPLGFGREGSWGNRSLTLIFAQPVPFMAGCIQAGRPARLGFQPRVVLHLVGLRRSLARQFVTTEARD